MNNDLTIAFIGFDGYSDMWDDCIGLYRHFWADCPFKTIFVNNSKDVKWDGVEVYHAGEDAEWSRKIQKALEVCDTPYICLMLEDFLVGSEIDTALAEKAIDLIKQDGIRYYRLANLNRMAKNRDKLYKGIPHLHIIPKSDEYGISLQPSIWEVNYLSELVGTENYNAWKFEFARVKEAVENDNTPVDGCVSDERNIFNLKHGVVQSKYIPQTVKYFKKLGMPLSIQRPVFTRRGIFSYNFTSFAKYHMPKFLRKPVKAVMERLGFKFVSTVRS